MQLIRSIEEIRLDTSWLTIGVFDGVHRGHQMLIEQLTAGAHRLGVPAVVLTFFPHPAIVLGNQKNFNCLTSSTERAELLTNLGVDIVISEPFTPELAAMSAGDFMSLVKKHTGLTNLLIGYDFALGKNRAGDFNRLSELGAQLGYQVQSVDAYPDANGIISSSRIRKLIISGQIEQANQALGYLYHITGPVISGDGRGRKINIPTANIEYPPNKALPPRGVYACRAWVKGKAWDAVTNIGIRPTFTPEQQTDNVETHILDFEQDIYGKTVKLEFVAHLRNEIKFPGADALLKQIRADIFEAKRRLQTEK